MPLLAKCFDFHTRTIASTAHIVQSYLESRRGTRLCHLPNCVIDPNTTSRMKAHVNISSKKAAANNISQVAVCDVRGKRTAAVAAFIEKAGTGANVMTDIGKERREVTPITRKKQE